MEIIVEKAGIYLGVMLLVVVGAGVALVITQYQWGWGDTLAWVGMGAILLSGIWRGLYASKADSRLLDAVKTENPIVSPSSPLGDVRRGSTSR